jgi:hypothetical protein
MFYGTVLIAVTAAGKLPAFYELEGLFCFCSISTPDPFLR